MFNPLPNDKIFTLTRIKIFAEDKLNVSKMMISFFDRRETSRVRIGNASYTLTSTEKTNKNWKIMNIYLIFSIIRHVIEIYLL